jgi:sulfur carrier protein ThiS
MTMNIRIVQLGRGVFKYAADEGATIADGLDAAGISVEHMDVRVRGRPAKVEDPLQDGDLVTVIPLIKGG